MTITIITIITSITIRYYLSSLWFISFIIITITITVMCVIVIMFDIIIIITITSIIINNHNSGRLGGSSRP